MLACVTTNSITDYHHLITVTYDVALSGPKFGTVRNREVSLRRRLQSLIFLRDSIEILMQSKIRQRAREKRHPRER